MPRRAIPEARRLAKQRFVGMRIASAREQAGINQRDLAAELGYSQGWLQAIESGRNGPTALDLQRLAERLNYPVQWFLDPDYRPSLRPRTRADWELIFGDQPERARAHAELDAVFARADRASEAPPDAN